jgi:3-deoxy-D-manno-octulosonic acid kinase
MYPIVTEQALAAPATCWRYVKVPQQAFDPVVFDERELQARDLVTGAASAGRGNTCFFELNGQAMVLRHYHRGGLARRISRTHYLFTGLERTRAMREFNVLLDLRQKGFPAPMPHACRVVRRGLAYSASLVTHRLDGQTLAARMTTHATSPLSDSAWQSIGATIARLHVHGYFHADLNAHNIILDSSDAVSLIDFDRARLRSPPAGNPENAWCVANIDRLQRSLAKLGAGSVAYEQGLRLLKQQWLTTLMAGHNAATG